MYSYRQQQKQSQFVPNILMHPLDMYIMKHATEICDTDIRVCWNKRKN